jgi:hypothetical protein
MIKVEQTNDADPLEFEVVVTEGGGESRHHVSMARETWERLAPAGQEPARCVEAAFRFLLDREPKESILGRFDITVISRYFPDFERELPNYLESPETR